jgi:hypothetical protein
MTFVPRRAVILGAAIGPLAACGVNKDTSGPQPPTPVGDQSAGIDVSVGSGKIVVNSLGTQPIFNILEGYGVFIGNDSSQTSAIQAALDTHPGRAFILPPGDYRLDTTLKITKNNSLILASDARIYAGESMEVLVDYDNGQTSTDGYAQDCSISGYGKLDGNLKAKTVIRIQSVLRFSLEGLTIVDGVNRGIVADSLGAELRGVNLRIVNTGTSNVSDNVGIEAKMSDCHFERVTMRDITVGIWDKSSNVWTNVHPWLGTTFQLKARYENSVAFLLAGDSTMINCYADTYRCSFRTDKKPYHARARMVAPQAYINPGNLTVPLAEEYPGVIFDITDGAIINVDNTGLFLGHPTTRHSFTSGSTDRFTLPGSSWGYLTGYSEYHRGVQLGTTTFTPTIYGSTTAGAQEYSTQSGAMEVRDGTVTYAFHLSANIDRDIEGSLRIGGLPLPPGAISVSDGNGPITLAAGMPTAVCVSNAGTSKEPPSVTPMTIGGTEIDSSAVAGTNIAIRASISFTFTYPS